MKTEPVRVVSLIVAIALAALPHLSAFGVMTEGQADALAQLLPSVLVLVGGEVARRRVSPVQE